MDQKNNGPEQETAAVALLFYIESLPIPIGQGWVLVHPPQVIWQGCTPRPSASPARDVVRT